MALTYNNHRVIPLKAGSTKHQYAFDVPKSRFLERITVKKPTYYRPIATRKTKLLAYVARLAKLTDRTRAKKHMSRGTDDPAETHPNFTAAVHSAIERDAKYKTNKGRYGRAYHSVKQDALGTRSYTRQKYRVHEAASAQRSIPEPPPMPPARSSTPYRTSTPSTPTLITQSTSLIAQSKAARRAEAAATKRAAQEELKRIKAHTAQVRKAAHSAGRKRK